jgi:N-acetyl-anhydromuramyl-L-alanine amidase AmpD
MTYSPLIDKAMPPTGRYQGSVKWSARPTGVRINGLNVHHWAGTNMSGLDRLVKSNDPASANYLILNDGTLIGSVPEEYRAWTTSASANDDDKITVEIQNETSSPSWRISDAAMATLIRLYADIAKRRNFPPIRANLKGHQEYGIATACPGPYLLPRLDDVARKAAALGTTTDTPEVPDMDATQAKQLSETRALVGQLKELLDEVHSGEHPKIDKTAATGAEKITLRTAIKETRLAVLGGMSATITAAVTKALASSLGVDPARIEAATERAVRDALADIPKEN